jgi:hypothetical protein
MPRAVFLWGHVVFDQLMDQLINFMLSLFAATVGTAIRLAKTAAANETNFPWRRLKWEAPTIFGVVFVAVPTARYLESHYGIDTSVVYAVCVLMGYLGTKVLDAITAFAEVRARVKDASPREPRD